MTSRTLAGVCFAVLVGACGAVDQPEPQDKTGSAEQSVLFECTGSGTWQRFWYRNNIEVGRDDCDCDGVVTRHGTWGSRYVQVSGPTC